VRQGLGSLLKQYKGKGVVIGIIDWGFDYTHPMFYDSALQNYRVGRAWDMNKIEGTPPQGFSYGAEYVGKDQLLQAKEDTLYVFGPGSHGTHVAGTAGGGGGGTIEMGIAPESELVFVSLLRTDAGYIDALNYLVNYAESQGKPLVVNMSFGGHLGPHDGSDMRSKATDYLGKAGRIFVGSAGNNGENKFHIKYESPGSVDTLKTVVNFVVRDDYYGQSLSIWGANGQDFSIGFRLVNTTNETVFQTPFYSSKDYPDNTDTFVFNGSDTFMFDYYLTEIYEDKGVRKGMVADLRKVSGLKVVLLLQADIGILHLWHITRLKRRHTNWGTDLSKDYPGAVEGDDAYGLGEPNGTGNTVLTVASYRGEVYFGNGNVNLGMISTFSSKGPTVDGRVKPDIAAPGQDVMSSVNSFDPNPGQIGRTVSFNGKDYHFVRYSGTSMSGPATAGVVALMLEANPWLSPSEVKKILFETARLDAHTGVLPQGGDLVWGNGKVNALAAVKMAEMFVHSPEVRLITTIDIYPNPFSDEIHLDADLFDGGDFALYALDGSIVFEGKVENKMIHLPDAESGMYILQLKNTNSIAMLKVVRQ
jgi:subtilisin family serine protease